MKQIVLALSLCFICPAIQFGYEDYYPNSKEALGRREARSHRNSLVRDFYNGRYSAGTPVQILKDDYPGCEVLDFDEFTELDYNPPFCFEGVKIIAKEGKLAYASLFSCAFSCIFFNSLSEQDQARYESGYMPALRKRSFGRWHAKMACCGALAVEGFDLRPR
jgi:hypothetical protein